MPFKFHVLEDLYTSIAIHSDPTRRWISVFHPWPLARMLSPQDLQSWMIQRFKYAAGAIDILVNDNPLFRRGLPMATRLMYAATFWANLSGLWSPLLVAAPILYLFTGLAPVRAYQVEFFMFIAPFVLSTELALRAASRGVPSWSGRLAYIAAFPLFLQALWTVLRGRRIAFPVTPKTREQGRFLHLVIPQIAILALSAAAVLAGVWRAQHGALTITGLVVNSFWCALNGMAMWKLVSAAWWQPRETTMTTPRRRAINASVVAAVIVATALLAVPAATSVQATAAGPTPQAHAPLTEREAGMARAAWSYFDANYQPTTCLANSVEGYPSTTLWDTASYIGALVAADRLKLISEHEASARLSCLLKTLASLDLVDDALPNKAYDTRSARMTNYQNQPGEIGTSAVDAGRLLIWLRIVKDRYPEQADAVDKAVLHWRFCEVLDAYGTLYGSYRQANGALTRVQEGRLGYEEYAAKGFQLWGFDTTRASQVDPFRRRNVDGISIEYDARDPKSFGAHTAVVSEPSLLDGLELNWDSAADRISADSMHTDGWAADYAERIYTVQERRFRTTGRLTARTEHHLNVAPYFVYDAILANDVPWNTVTEDSLAVPQFAAVSSRAAIAMWALWRTDYTTQLFEAQAPLADPSRGFFEGVYEAGAVIPVRTANTNGIILEALLHKVEGKLLRPGAPRNGLWERTLADPAACGAQCLPRGKSGVAR